MKRSAARVVVQAGGIVVRRQGRRLRVLIVRSSDGLNWLFPKGHVERGETAERAAVREVREEAGVKASVVRFAGRQRYANKRRRVQVSYYVLEYRRKARAEDDREIRWCTRSEARRKLSFEGLKRILDRAVLE